MFNKAERARRQSQAEWHGRQYKLLGLNASYDDPNKLEAESAQAFFHRKQAELWTKYVVAFDRDVLAKARLMRRTG